METMMIKRMIFIGGERSTLFEGKNILVTGGTGSLGKVLVRRLLSGKHGPPQSVTVFSRDEAKQYDMRMLFAQSLRLRRRHLPGPREDSALPDWRRARLWRAAAGASGVDIVFNAAALKQVPNCEYFPAKQSRPISAARSTSPAPSGPSDLPVEAVIGISTDKACHPSMSWG